MRLLEKCFYPFCLLTCVCCTGYMIYSQFKYYLNNEDMASISYRIFNNEEQDEYPSFSLCFNGFGGKIFNQSHDIFNSNNVTRESYGDYLLGLEKDYPADFTTAVFDDVVVDIHEGYLIEFGGIVAPFHLNPLIEDLITTFRSSREICVSKKIVHRKNVKQEYDYIRLNSSMLYEQNLDVSVHVHKKGQLIRSMATEDVITKIYSATLKDGVYRDINIGQVDILRKRADGKIPCDQDMEDEDEYRMEQIIQSVGCIPTFWTQLAVSIGLNQTNPICKTAMDYSKVRTQLSNIWANISTLDITQKLHCTMMMASVTTRDQTAFVRPEQFLLRFKYHGNSYREIKNTKAYTRETLLGQIGGFVGMQYQF